MHWPIYKLLHSKYYLIVSFRTNINRLFMNFLYHASGYGYEDNSECIVHNSEYAQVDVFKSGSFIDQLL